MSIDGKNSTAYFFLDSRRQYSITRKNDSMLIVGGLGVVVAAATAQYGLGMYENYVAKRAAEQPAAAKTKRNHLRQIRTQQIHLRWIHHLLLRQHGFQKKIMMGDLKTK